MLSFGQIRERIRESLWIWPVLTMLVAGALGALLTTLRPLQGGELLSELVVIDASQTHPLLATLLGAIITASSIIASLTIVALQTSSTQYSPRLLRNFVRDPVTQAVLSTYMGVAGYLIAVFVLARGDEPPQLAFVVAMAGIATSVVVIVFFFNHVSQSIRVESIIKEVAEESMASAVRLAGYLDGLQVSFESFDGPADEATIALADRSGYVQQIHIGSLVATSAERGIEIWITPQLGQWVLAGTPIAHWSGPGSDHDGRESTIGSEICEHVDLGYERTLHHDTALGIRQLVDIANRAMSPSVNDPYTAVQAIDHLGPILAGLGHRRIGDHIATGSGRGWVAVPGTSFAEFAALATDQIRRSGAHEPAVALALMNLLADVAAVVDPDHGDDLRRLITRILIDARREIPNADDLVEVEETAQRLIRRTHSGPQKEPVRENAL